MPNFNYKLIGNLNDPLSERSYSYSQIVVDDNDMPLGLDYVNDQYLYTYPYMIDEEVGSIGSEVSFDSLYKTRHPGYYWPWEGLGLEIQAILPTTVHTSYLSTFITVYLFDSETVGGQCIGNATSGNSLRDCCTAYPDNALWYWHTAGVDIYSPFFYIASEDDPTSYIYFPDSGNIELAHPWNTGYASGPGHLGIFDFPFNTRYSKLWNTDSVQASGQPDITNGEWYENNGEIMPVYLSDSEDDLENWSNQILNNSSKFFVVVRMGGDESGWAGRDERNKIYYKFTIKKTAFKRLIEDETVDKRIIEYGGFTGVIDDDPVGNPEYAGYWKSTNDYPRNMGLAITGDNNNNVEDFNRYNMVTGHQDNDGDPKSGFYNEKDAVWRLHGIRFVLSGPGGIDRNMVTGTSDYTDYDPYELIILDSLGTLGSQENSWSKNLGFVDNSPTCCGSNDEWDEEYESSDYEYNRFDPRNKVDYLGFKKDERPTDRSNQFRPISNVYISSHTTGDHLNTQVLYDVGTDEYYAVSAPTLVKLGFEISTIYPSISLIENSELITNTDANASYYYGSGYKFTVLRWGDEDEGFGFDGLMDEIMDDFNEELVIGWQEVYGPGPDIKRGELSHMYSDVGIYTIIAAVFSYRESTRLDSDSIIQPMRWKLVKIVLKLNEGLLLSDDFAELGGKDFTIIPWIYGGSIMIGGISDSSKYSTSIESTFNGGEFDIIKDANDLGKIYNSRSNDELGDWPGKLDIEQTRVFVTGSYDMHKLLMIDEEVTTDGTDWRPYWDETYWTGEITYNEDGTEVLTDKFKDVDESCVGTLYINQSTNPDLRNEAVLELNAGDIDRRKILDTSGKGNMGLLIGDYGIKKIKGQKMQRDTFIDIPGKGKKKQAL